MKKSEFKALIREEVRKVLKEAADGSLVPIRKLSFVKDTMTIGDILANGKRAAQGDIAKWTWTSIPTLNSRYWKGMNQAKKFEPLIKQLEKYSSENVVKFFGKKEYMELERLQHILSDTDGKDRKPEEYAKAFDAIYSIVYGVLKTK